MTTFEIYAEEQRKVEYNVDFRFFMEEDADTTVAEYRAESEASVAEYGEEFTTALVRGYIQFDKKLDAVTLEDIIEVLNSAQLHGEISAPRYAELEWDDMTHALELRSTLSDEVVYLSAIGWHPCNDWHIDQKLIGFKSRV